MPEKKYYNHYNKKTQPVAEKQTDQFLSTATTAPVSKAYEKITLSEEVNKVLNVKSLPNQNTTRKKVDAPSHNVNQQPKQQPKQQTRNKPRNQQTENKNHGVDNKKLPVENNNQDKQIKTLKNTNNNTAKSINTNVSVTNNSNTPNKTPNRRNARNNSAKNKIKPSLKVYFLGGLNEIGKNFTAFECQGEIVILDCGLAFPTDDMLGIDIVIPDFTFVEKNMDKIKGVVITHGHEDHIGALPYLLKKINVPIYGTPLTIGLIQGKLKEHNLNGLVNLNPTQAGSHVKLGCFDVELIHVNHSIADAVGIAMRTPAGLLVHTGDFKIDFTPAEGEMINLARFAELGKEGVLALMADSTNAGRSGYTQTEQTVNSTLDVLFAKAEKKRIIVATFASSISRVQMIINCAVKYGRKVALSGRSMLNVVSIATELGYLNVPEGLIIELSTINRYTKDQIILITTGSQGEPMAALSRMASAEHRQVEVGENDFIIISARPIPGNEKTVGGVVDELLKRGCEVIYESMYDLHVSGHACEEELKLMQALIKPKFFIPVHGEQKHLRKHASIAMTMGVPEENIFIGNVGKGIEINQDYIKPTPDVPAGSVMVDGLGVGDVGSIVLRDRKHLGEDGLIIVVCTIDGGTGTILSGPDIVSRGFVYVRESEELMDTARKLAYQSVESCAEEGVREWSAIKIRIRDSLSKFLYERTRRSPMILPIITEV